MTGLPPCPRCGSTEYHRDPDTTTPNAVDDTWYCANGHEQSWSLIHAEDR